MFVPIKQWSCKCIHILQDGYCLRSFTSGCRIMHSHYQEKRQNKAYCELVWCCPSEVEYFHLIKLVVVRLSKSKREQLGIRDRKGFFAFPRFPLLIARPRKSRFLLHLLLWWFVRVTNRILLWDRRARPWVMLLRRLGIPRISHFLQRFLTQIWPQRHFAATDIQLNYKFELK